MLIERRRRDAPMKRTPSNLRSTTWVCFDCRQAVRRGAFGAAEEPRCARCRAPLVRLGHKITLPKRTDRRGWRDLRDCYRRGRASFVDRGGRARARRIHQLEREIRHLEGVPENPGKRRSHSLLRKKLESLRAHSVQPHFGSHLMRRPTD